MIPPQLTRESGVATDTPTVRPGVKAFVRSSDSVLLVRESRADGTSFWTLPGGGVCPNETPTQALRRELAEELRCPCVVGERLGLVWYAHRTRRKTVSQYTVRVCHLWTRPRPARTEGITDVTWARPGECPTRTLPQVRALLDRQLGQ
jgi:8-oxo-dGTP diphosphatase